MNCSKHHDATAVAQCSICGAGVCAECAEITKDARESRGVLCVDCYRAEMEEMTGNVKKKNNKRLSRVIISGILYVLGIIVAICGIGDPDAVIFIAIGIVLCGIYTGLTWKQMAQDQHDRDEMKNGATYVITDDGIYKKDGFWLKVVYFIIGVLLGVVVTPINVIVGSVTYAKTRKFIKAAQAEIHSLSQI